KQPPVPAVRAFPVVDSVGGHWPTHIFVNPDLLSRRRVERHDGTVFRQNVNHAANLDGIEKVSCAITGRISPRDPQFAHVRAIDLLQCGILRRIRRPVIFTPRCMRVRKRRKTAEECWNNAVKGQTASITAALSPSIPDAALFRQTARW